MEVQALERALNYAKGVHVQTGYRVLVDALEEFLRTQKKTYPVITKPSDTGNSEWIKRMGELIKKGDENRCPYCGCVGVHFCTGRQPGGIEYWMNQPTSVCHPIPGGSIGVAPEGATSGYGRDYFTRSVNNGGQGIQLGKSFGSSCS